MGCVILARLCDRTIYTLVAVALRVLPPRDTVVVHGWRDGEENGLRVVGALSKVVAKNTRLVLLCEDPSESRAQLEIALRHACWHPDRIERLKKNSAVGLIAFLQARVVFSTHGLWGNPAPGPRRLHVLLGHGHGPKSASDPAHPFIHRAQLATTNNAVWGGAVIRDQAIAPANTIVTGNPRDDAFDEPAPRERLGRLGIAPEMPIALWLPTFRVPRYSRMHADIPDAVDNPRLQQRLRDLREAAEAMDVTIITKAHQLDDQRNAERWGIPSVTNDSLREAGLSFFQLLNLSDGLISDYSSVWVDYLRTLRPTGLLLFDEVEFAQGRGFNEPSIKSVAGELVVQEKADAERFITDVRAYFDSREPRGDVVAVADRLGLRRESNATNRVIEATEQRLRTMGLPRWDAE